MNELPDQLPKVGDRIRVTIFTSGKPHPDNPFTGVVTAVDDDGTVRMQRTKDGPRQYTGPSFFLGRFARSQHTFWELVSERDIRVALNDLLHEGVILSWYHKVGTQLGGNEFEEWVAYEALRHGNGIRRQFDTEDQMAAWVQTKEEA